MGKSLTAATYLQQVILSLLKSNDIQVVVVGGIKVWQFSPYAAQTISTWVSGMTSIGVRAQVPFATSNGNTIAWTKYEEQATNLIRSFIFGSRIYGGNAANGINPLAK